jgi:hypothetical protein
VILNFNEEIFSETKLNFDFHDLKKPENILFSTGLRFDKRQIRKVKEYRTFSPYFVKR